MANTKVQSEQIEDGSITADKLADGTIVAAELADNAVTTAKINADAVTGAKIADDAIDSEHYTDGSIDTAHIADAQITVAKMAANSVDSDQYVDGSIDTVHLGDLQITTAKIANGNISTAKIADNAVTSAKLDTNIDIAGTFDVTGATTLDSTLSVAGNVSIGVTPKTWHADWEVLQIGERASFFSQASTTTGIGENVYYDSGWKAIATAAGSLYQQDSGNHHFYTMASVSADATSSPSEKFTILNNGNVGIGTASPASTLHVDKSFSGTLVTFHQTAGSTSNDRGLDVETSSTGTTVQRWLNSGTELMRVGGNGNVGIGETTPLGKLHIKSADSAASSVNANANELVVENSDYTGISILGENECNIHFGDNEDPDVGRIEYHHSSNSMIFRTNASDAMTITSDGTLKTTAGSNVTTVSGSTSFLIHESADVKNVADSSTGSATYRDMHRFYCNKSGQFKVKWQALIHSGSHYWAGRFLLNGSQMKKSDNSTDATHYFGSSLASGESASVHVYRTFEMDLGDVKAGVSTRIQNF